MKDIASENEVFWFISDQVQPYLQNAYTLMGRYVT